MDRAVARQHNDGGLGLVLHRPLEQVEPVLVRQVDVAQHQVERVLGQALHRVLAGRGRFGPVAEAAEVFRNRLEDVFVVVNDEQ